MRKSTYITLIAVGNDDTKHRQTFLRSALPTCHPYASALDILMRAAGIDTIKNIEVIDHEEEAF